MSSDDARSGLQPQELTLTIFGAYARSEGEQAWSGGLVQLLGLLGFSSEAARAALARLAARNLLARHKAGRLVSYSLTPRAEAVLAQGDRRIFSFGRSAHATDTWTVLWHAIPADRRVERWRLAARLRFLGFGSVQDATWVAASNREQDVLPLLRELDVEAYASVVVGRLSHGLPPVALVAQAWDLDAVEASYRAFAADYGALLAPGALDTLDAAQAFVERTLMLHRFRGFPFSDPEIVDGYETLAAARREVVAVFDALYAALAAPAEAYFREAVSLATTRA